MTFKQTSQMDTTIDLIRAPFKPGGIRARLCFLAFLAVSNAAHSEGNRFERVEKNAGKASKVAVSVKGRITDEKGEGLPGVSILVKGKTVGTTSNLDGTYSLNVPSSGDILVFSFVGYITKEVVVGNQSTIDIQLEVDSRALDELVVVGYGTVKKSDLTGSVSTLQVNDMIKARLGTLPTRLQDVRPGCACFPTTGSRAAVSIS